MNHQGAVKHILDRLDKELPSHLTYHGQHHTLDVLETVERIGKHEGISEQELNLLLVAAAYHDSGFIYGQEDHEERSCEIASETLPEFGFSKEVIQHVQKMIMATKVPQHPTGELSDILCDADLDYLGRDDFNVVAKTLFQELEYIGAITDEKQWNRIQVGFLKEHHYHTSYGKLFRQPKKEEHLKYLEALVASYDS